MIFCTTKHSSTKGEGIDDDEENGEGDDDVEPPVYSQKNCIILFKTTKEWKINKRIPFLQLQRPSSEKKNDPSSEKKNGIVTRLINLTTIATSSNPDYIRHDLAS